MKQKRINRVEFDVPLVINLTVKVATDLPGPLTEEKRQELIASQLRASVRRALTGLALEYRAELRDVG